MSCVVARKMAKQLLHSHQCTRPLRDWNNNTKGGTREVQDATKMPDLPDDDLRDTLDEEEWVREYERLISYGMGIMGTT